MEPFALILAAMLAQTEAGIAPPPPPPAAATAGPLRADADGDGVVTRAEWLGEFDRLDTNHDGRLTRDERRAGRPPRGDRPDRPPRMEPGDDRRGPPMQGDGPMRDATRAEYLDRAAKRFDRLDANHDGRIDAAEMAAAHPRLQGRSADAPAPDRDR